MAAVHAPAQTPGVTKTYLLVHGAWHGGWCWRAQDGWTWREIATAHDAMVTAPVELTQMLLEISSA